MSMLRLLLRQQRLLQQACVTQTWWPAATASAGLQVQQRYCNIPESEDVGELEFFSEPPETQLTSGALRPDSSSKASSSGFAPPAAGTANAQPPHNSSSSTRQLSKLHQAESAVLTLQQKVRALDCLCTAGGCSVHFFLLLLMPLLAYAASRQCARGDAHASQQCTVPFVRQHLPAGAVYSPAGCNLFHCNSPLNFTSGCRCRGWRPRV
jgi:hypothetical protein